MHTGFMVITVCSLLLSVIGLVRCNQYCCYPDIWEANVAIQGAFPGSEDVPGVMKVDTRIYYDFPNRRWAVVGYIKYINGDEDETYWIEDYKNNKLMVIKNGLCHEGEFTNKPRMQRQCFSDKDNFMGYHWLGAGYESIPYEEWIVDTPDYNVTTSTSRSTDAECIPLSEFAVYKVPKKEEQVHVGYSDVSKHISDYEVFDLEEYCSTADKLKKEELWPSKASRHYQRWFRETSN